MALREGDRGRIILLSALTRTRSGAGSCTGRWRPGPLEPGRAGIEHGRNEDVGVAGPGIARPRRTVRRRGAGFGVRPGDVARLPALPYLRLDPPRSRFRLRHPVR